MIHKFNVKYLALDVHFNYSVKILSNITLIPSRHSAWSIRSSDVGLKMLKVLWLWTSISSATEICADIHIRMLTFTTEQCQSMFIFRDVLIRAQRSAGILTPVALMHSNVKSAAAVVNSSSLLHSAELPCEHSKTPHGINDSKIQYESVYLSSTEVTRTRFISAQCESLVCCCKYGAWCFTAIHRRKTDSGAEHTTTTFSTQLQVQEMPLKQKASKSNILM